MSRLKIDLVSGVIEVEGEETFVQGIYDEYKVQLQEINKFDVRKTHLANSPTLAPTPGPEKNKVTKVKRNKQNLTPTFVKDLDLSSKNGKSLRDFFGEKTPSSAMESNAVFVYYLQKTANVSNIDFNHVYTCYKDVGVRRPTALKQSLIDTASGKGWLNTSSLTNLKLTTSGENFVELDLPREDKEKTR